jgi:hypothetical protein
MHRIGDGLFTSAGLVGAAMYSACWRVHMTAVVHLGGRVAGSAGSALRSERPFNLHITAASGHSVVQAPWSRRTACSAGRPLTTEHDIAFRIDVVNATHRLGDIETDCCKRLDDLPFRIVGALSSTPSVLMV